MKDHDCNELKRPRIPNEKRKDCLSLFQHGIGYKKVATITGLKRSATREYIRGPSSRDQDRKRKKEETDK